LLARQEHEQPPAGSSGGPRGSAGKLGLKRTTLLTARLNRLRKNALSEILIVIGAFLGAVLVAGLPLRTNALLFPNCGIFSRRQ
jgi:hypothetical protein